MRGQIFYLTLFIIAKTSLAFSQDFGFTQYDIKNGLAGSIVYCVAQDKEGFLWFGTETGLSRFDGSRFVNFTSFEGLPDNEIIDLLVDSKGRVWIIPFRSALCYYYRGSIYTKENDSILKKINLSSFVVNICEDIEGNILLMERRRLHLIGKDGSVTVINNFNGNSNPNFVQIGRHHKGGFWLKESNKVYHWQNNKAIFYKNFTEHSDLPMLNNFSGRFLAYPIDYLTYALEDVESGTITSIKYRISKNRIVFLRDSILVLCSREGAMSVNIRNFRDSVEYLKGIAVNTAFIDHEKNMWFCTGGQGVYKLNSEAIRNITIREKEKNVGITSISTTNGKMLFGGDNETLYQTDIAARPLKFLEYRGVYNFARSPITDIECSIPNFIFFGTGQRLFKLSSDFKKSENFFGVNIKHIIRKNENQFIAVTGANVFVFDPHSFKITDTIWNKRATSAFVQNDTLYIGSIDGVFRLLPNGSSEFLGDRFSVFKNRVTHIVAHRSGTLWMSTFGEGVIGYRQGRVVAHLTLKHGLTSNICKALFLYGDHLWVGTDKGLNKILLSDTSYPVTQFTTADGLASDNINTVFQLDSTVYAGSSAGVTYFNEKYVAGGSACILRITAIKVSDKAFAYDSTNFTLPRLENNIRFEFAGISFRSVGDVLYRHRLLGLDTNWVFTRENFLNYPTLPPGHYELQIQAINKYGVRSEIKKIKFSIEPFLWERIWFRILMIAIFIFFAITLLRQLNKRVRIREEEKTRINARVAELEQLALKSQMNPHFIFNSLNSIQQYVMDKDVSGANKFISGFSRLIRQTLDFSSKPLVHLQDEIGYLKTYLELEKNRLEEKFNYEVEVSEELRNEDYYIPPMVLQPFLENSLRHGIRYRKDNKGRIMVRVYKGDREIVCVIEDNGVGREQAARNKRANPIEYQSKGMTLTANRIDLINKGRQEKIKVAIEDMFHADGSPGGTRVTVSFPEEMA
jgi:ligand-binding sensor domain-containing protein